MMNTLPIPEKERIVNELFEMIEFTVKHCLDEDCDGDEFPITSETLRRALAFDANSLPHLHAIAVAAMFLIDWRSEFRRLTGYEHRIHDIAQRLWVACNHTLERYRRVH